MKKSEAVFQTLFKHYIEKNPPEKSTAYELKYEKGGTFNFKAWTKKAPHQLSSLLDSKHKILYHKISDSAIGFKPYDCFILKNAGAFLVIYFEKFKESIQIDADIALQNKDKSLSFEDIKKIGETLNI